MHVVEHVGLGRFGDPLDAQGDAKAVRELIRVLAPEGELLLVVPVGRPRVCFNAHRIYSYGRVLELCSGLDLCESQLVPDDPSAGGLVEASAERIADQAYGCGCFRFRKPAEANLSRLETP